MADVLLDSSALFYYVSSPSKFGRKSKSLLDSGSLFFSPISLVELKLKALSGKLKLASIDPKDFEALGFQLLSFDAAAAHEFQLWANQDPFDNMLLAQARTSGCKFLTSDLKILNLNFEFVADLTD